MSEEKIEPWTEGEERANAEWRLCEFVDTLAAEVDCVGDTLGLKSYARGLAFAVKKLSLDVAVGVRVDADGRILFRTTPADRPGSTVLRLELAQVLEGQLEGVRKPLDGESDSRPVAVLPGISREEVRALESLGIFTVDDLGRYTRTSGRIAEVARRTGIAEARLRGWVGLPFLTGVEPAKGRPGDRVAILGGGLGDGHGPGAKVLFQGREAEVLAWSDRRIVTQVPPGARSGLVFLVLHGAVTNAVAWEEDPVDLRLHHFRWKPSFPAPGRTALFAAALVNNEKRPTGPVDLQGEIDGLPVAAWSEPGLAPGEERTVQFRAELPSPGEYDVRLVLDPGERIAIVDRSASIAGGRVVTASIG